MPALKSFSAAEEEDDQLCPNLEADRFNPEAQDEEDPDGMDQDDDESGSEEDEDDVERDEEEVEAENDEALEEEEDSKETSESSSSEEKSQSLFLGVELAEIRRDVQCPICLGIIRKTRSVMGCLHRFCRECIDKSMRLGNNECPACRKHCASRRSLRDDPRFDAFIAAVFGDIDSYEAEELAVHDDDLARRKQIQVSIAQVSKKQSEALVKRKSVLPRSQGIGSSSRRRRNCRNMEQDTLEEADEDADDDDDDNNNGGEDSSSDEPSAETLQRKRRKRSATRSTAQPSSSIPNNNDNNGTEEAHHRDSSRVISPEMLAWGGGGTRSNSRQGGHYQGLSSKNVRNARLNRLMEYLGSLESRSAELDIHLLLTSVDTNCIPNLPEPYLCCRPTMLVKELREYVALKTQLKAEEVELLVTKDEDKATEGNISSSSTEKMQSVKDDETLAKLKADCISGHDYLIVVYQQKQIG